ncbi:MAG: PQQ-binding-like beta-propeller repeat protein [Solirubrobacterales bacterium]
MKPITKASALLLLAIATAVATLSYAAPVWAAQEPVTAAANALRTGWYPDEPQLTPQLLKGGGFGLNFDTPVQGQVYAQPLVSGGTLLAATEDNWVYGIDPQSGATKWQRSVGTPWNSEGLSCADLGPHVGITGTPVIDPATDVAYFFSKTYASGTSGPAVWNMHAVDLSNGLEKEGFPLQISGKAQNFPEVEFKPAQQLQRPALLLMNGVVYAAFGSHCDSQPYQGWIVGVSTSGQIKAMWAASPEGAAIWQGGGGLVSDGEGQILFATGNSFPPLPPEDLGESVVRVVVQTGGSLKATDSFSPFNRAQLDEWDLDLGSGGPLGLPSPYFGTEAKPHLMVEVGKEGVVYLLDRDELGGFAQGAEGKDKVLQEISGGHGLWGSMAAWPGDGGYIYIPSKGTLEVLKYGTEAGSPHLSLAATSPEFLAFGSGSPLVTSNGTTAGSGIVWISQCSNPPGCEGSTLNAYGAVPVEGVPQLLWSGKIGVSTKFARPDASGGRIYVGTRDGHLLGFGATHHTLAVTREGGAGSSVGSNIPGIACGTICSQAFPNGTQVSLTASPADHFEFTGWSGGGCAGAGACNVAMYSDISVTASFAPITHILTVSKAGTGAGLITSKPAGISCRATCSARFDDAVSVTLKATPNHSKVRWRGCSSAAANTCRVKNLERDRKVTAIFARLPETTITKVTIQPKKRTATFSFRGIGTARGFQCALIKPRGKHRKKPRTVFSSCASPKTFSHLEPGRYTFVVRAVNSAGPDPKPARRRFEI